MKPKVEHHPRRHRAKLPPLLEITDEDDLPGLGFAELEGRRWSSDSEDDDLGVQLGDWPSDSDH